MTATRPQYSTTQAPVTPVSPASPVLYLAFELGWSEWKLAFATGPADNPRLRSIGGRNTQALLQEIAKAKQRFGLPADAPVVSCYEAGRDGFWLHRYLAAQGTSNSVVDSSSIEVMLLLCSTPRSEASLRACFGLLTPEPTPVSASS